MRGVIATAESNIFIAENRKRRESERKNKVVKQLNVNRSFVNILFTHVGDKMADARMWRNIGQTKREKSKQTFLGTLFGNEFKNS